MSDGNTPVRRRIAPWQILLLSIAFAMTAAGAIVATLPSGAGVDSPAPAPRGANIEDLRQGEGANFTREQVESAARDAGQAAQRWWERAAPHVWRVGLAFFVAFVAGFAFRNFVKTAAMVAGGVLVLVVALTYFQIVDFQPAVQQGLARSQSAFTDLADYLQKTTVERLPATVTGVLGFVAGFVRR
jgi:uncharacterized membrane protein (Fun14 family)